MHEVRRTGECCLILMTIAECRGGRLLIVPAARCRPPTVSVHPVAL